MVRGLLYRVCGEENLDDLTQESFIKVWKNFGSFREKSSPKTWIYRIVMNTAMDELRKRTRRLRQIDDSVYALEVAGGEAVAVDVQMGEKSVIETAFQELSDEHRMVLVLTYFDELTVEEIAGVFQLPIGTIKSRIFYAKKELKRILLSMGVTGL